MPDLTICIRDHSPSQAGYLLGPKPGLGRKQEDDPVSGRPSGRGQVAQDGLDLALAQRLRLFPQSYDVLQIDYLSASGRWTITSQERSYMPTGRLSLADRDLDGLMIEG